jgi:single-strand selective monofunctional uracil DNA glycosylase
LALETSQALIDLAAQLVRRLDRMRFADPVTYVYNPFDYARAAYAQYLQKYAAGPKRVLFLGMNPGPFGMVQTGVPFGEVSFVRDWLGIQAEILQPPRQHEKRPIQGFGCQRSEVSGFRLWGFFSRRFGPPEKFFASHLVMNYCPLAFVEESGKNRTPDKLPPAEREALYAACDEHLLGVVRIVQPEWVVGVGEFARNRAALVCESVKTVRVCSILHPSPASPAANRDWPGSALKQLQAAGVWPHE